MNSKLWVALALSGTLSLIAQNNVLAASLGGESTLPFSATYNITADFESGVLGEVSESGTGSNAPFGLTNFEARSYYNSKLELSSDPTAIGGRGLPQGSIVFSGSGSNKLFATSIGSIYFDNDQLLFAGWDGTLTFTGGEGDFSGAKGTGSFASQVSGILGSEPGYGDFSVYDASITIPHPVPEPSTVLGFGMALSFGALMKRQYSRRRKKIKQVG